MFYPGLNTVKELARDFRLVPLSMEMYADTETPISILKRFEDSGFCFLLESVEGGEKWARYSFIGRDPFLTVRCNNKKTTVHYKNGDMEEVEGNPLEVLKSLTERYRSAHIQGLPRFCGGGVGFFGYDIVRYYENLPDVPADELDLPDYFFMFMDEVLVFDHLKQKINIIVNVHTDRSIERSYRSAEERIREIYREIVTTRWKVTDSKRHMSREKRNRLQTCSNVSREEYCQNVVKAKQYIKNGDIFQLDLSRRIQVETDSTPMDVYRALRVLNPSPYMFYLKFDELRIVGSSPEMLVRVENGTVETCPIAGTRKRGSTPGEDQLLEQELLKDEKEIAEHMMLVDLARNDIGKVSEFGSVVVKDLKHVEKYSHVMHLVTGVQGKLREGLTAFDALASVLPAGTLSGAPKIRAMQIIDELEKVKRCTYGGAVGYLGFDGSLDSCITIRTMVFTGKKTYIQAGAGIVADSIPEKEYEESENKAGALLKALEEAGEII